MEIYRTARCHRRRGGNAPVRPEGDPLRSVPAIDASAMRALHELADRAAKKKIQLIFSHVNEQPLSVMKKDGFYDRIGADSFRPNIVDAIRFAESKL